MTAGLSREGQRPLRVLVVDDNRDAADTMALMVQLWGHAARVAYDGLEGLRTALEYEPDCLLLDIGMPRMDGYHLAQRLRAEESLRQSKLVAMTAYSDELNVRRAWEAGFDYHLVKPADPEVIRSILAMLDKVLRLTEKTESLADRTVELTKETKTLLTDVKEEMKEVKQDIKEVKEDLREVKQDLRGMRAKSDDTPSRVQMGNVARVEDKKEEKK
jgi:two-component system OmpR family response regulator